MQVYRLSALSDNYIFLLHEPEQNIAAVVDPAEASPVLERLKELGVTLVAIFNTHHHSDHVGGNIKLLQQFPEAVVYGGAEDRGRIPGQTVFLQEGDRVSFGNQSAEVLFVPGHTRAHIAYYFAPTPVDVGNLFCGDTLFAGGCGRLFEGTPTQMVDSLGKLRALPDETRVWCAHEYTLKNLEFALTVDRTNLPLRERLAAVKTARSQNESTIPSNLGIEKRTNPFLRWDDLELRAIVKAENDIQTFARLRGMRERF
jgi:hydroxyacylglutathione hydrolase